MTVTHTARNETKGWWLWRKVRWACSCGQTGQWLPVGSFPNLELHLRAQTEHRWDGHGGALR